MRRGSPPCSPGVLGSGFAPALHDQLVHEAARATSAPELLLHPPEELPAGFEHDAPPVDSRCQLVPWLDAERTAHRRGQNETSLGADAQRSCHSAISMA